MAVNNTAKTYSNMEFPLSMKRQDAFSLDPTCVWPSMADAQNYAKTNPTAYIGQVLSVVVDGVATSYTIQNAAGDLAPLLLAEVEFPSEEEANSFPPPDWFGEDVTFSSKYHNSTLSQKKD